jgi:shikimate dehydrogenase
MAEINLSAQVEGDGGLYGLIGYPLSHSFSKKYFEEKFEKESLTNCRFANFSIPSIKELPAIIANNPDLKGLAVTIPYKQEVLDYLHYSQIPAGLNACNCIKIAGDKLLGYNTDYIGFEKSFSPLLEPHHNSALVLGNGGATAAVLFTLKQLGILYTVVSRKLHTGSDMVYEEVTEELIRNTSIIINTTPLGMYPKVNDCAPIPYYAITKDHFLYDLVYNPEKTLFLQRGELQGAVIKNGADMLALQADENWRIWNT